MAELKIGILFYNRDPRTLKAIEIILNWSKKQKNILIHWANEISFDVLENEMTLPIAAMRRSDLIISIGGDGTFLSAARLVAGLQTPILGVHTGTTGFLTDYPVESLGEALEEITQHSMTLVPRLMLDINILRPHRKPEKDMILNEILIKPTGSAQMVNLSVEINGTYLTDYWADFLIISTPTGSTAYNLAAGGPIVYPSSESVILNAVNPPSLSVRPLVIPATAKIKVKNNENTDLVLILDGRVEKTISAGAELEMSQSAFVTHFVKSKQYGFVDALRKKLGWCGDFRNTRGNNEC